MMLRSWPRIERDGGCLCVAFILEQGQKGNDDHDEDEDDDDDDELWCCPLKDTEDK